MKTIKILQHTIEYWYEQDQEMPHHEQEHVQELIIEGFNQGQLVDGDNTGWWKIVFARH